MIAEETTYGTVKVSAYVFPSVTLTAPHKAVTNITPYNATFKAFANTTVTMTFTWDFGDGTEMVTSETIPDYLSRPNTTVTHTYETPGEYTVTMTVTDPYGMSKQYTAIAYAYALPSRDLTIMGSMSNSYSRAPVTGYYKYSISGGLTVDSPITNSWSVDGVTLSEKSNVSIVFPNPGTYSVGLAVKTKYGNNVSASKTVEVIENVPPTCTITQNKLLSNQYQLIANCTDTDGKVVAYKWDLPGGIVAKAQKAYITLKTAGTYSIKVTATDDSGGEGTTTGTIVVQ
jgi:PKD repeat protein